MATVVLDVVIGIVFVFMLFSLLLSALLEAVAAILKLRGRALRVAIARLVDDPKHPVRWGGFGFVDRVAQRLGGEPGAVPPAGGLVADVVDPTWPEAFEAATEADNGDYAALLPVNLPAVLCHPLIAGASEANKPSYVPSANFSSALVHVLLDGSADASLSAVQHRIMLLPAGTVRDALQTALLEARGDWDAFKSGIERWYDHAMDRLSGEYKRFAQLITFLLGLGLAAAFDIDPLRIAQQFYADPVLREAVVQEASDVVDQEMERRQKAAAVAGGASAAEMSLEERMKAIGVARRQLLDSGAFALTSKPRPQSFEEWSVATRDDPVRVIGWLLTAFAGMLGAPFWFELLQKLANLRGAGPKPLPATPTEQTP